MRNLSTEAREHPGQRLLAGIHRGELIELLTVPWRERVTRRLAWWGWAWRNLIWPAIRGRRDPHRIGVLLWCWLVLSGWVL